MAVSWSTPGAARSLGHSTKIPPFRDDMGETKQYKQTTKRDVFVPCVLRNQTSMNLKFCLNESLFQLVKQTKIHCWLVVEPTHSKKMLVKMGSSSPIFGLKIPKNVFLKPPPSFSVYGQHGMIPPLATIHPSNPLSLNSTPLRKVGCKC